MENKGFTNSDKFKHALCYVPLIAIILFFAEDKKSKVFIKHIKYGVSLLIIYLAIRFIIGTILSLDNLTTLLTTIYLGVCIYLGYKAYKGDDINLEYIDKFEEKVKENIDTTAVEDVAKKVKAKVESKKTK